MRKERELVKAYRRAWLDLFHAGTEAEKSEYLKSFTGGDQARAFCLGVILGLVMALAFGILMIAGVRP